jgi:hypothetical protein
MELLSISNAAVLRCEAVLAERRDGLIKIAGGYF